MTAEMEKFWARVKKEDGCWKWLGRSLPKGRGYMWWNGKNITAPRIMWEVTHGAAPPKGHSVCHSCDNPNCVNPAHLWLGTQSANLEDAASKKRIGKMTPELVRQMRAEHKAGASMRAIARKYGMSTFPVKEAISGRAWKHVD
jgi:hypothetical protein